LLITTVLYSHILRLPSQHDWGPEIISNLTDYDDYARRKYKKDIDSLKPDLVSYNKQRAAATGSGASTSSALVSGSSTSVIQRAAAENLYRNMDSLVYADHRPTEEAVDRVVGKLNLECVRDNLLEIFMSITTDVSIHLHSIDKRSKRSRVRKEEDGEITYINVSGTPLVFWSWRDLLNLHFFFFHHHRTRTRRSIKKWALDSTGPELSGQPHSSQHSLPTQIGRFYNQYTEEIRENIERGTAL
jgi:hypothetical protein